MITKHFPLIIKAITTSSCSKFLAQFRTVMYSFKKVNGSRFRIPVHRFRVIVNSGLREKVFQGDSLYENIIGIVLFGQLAFGIKSWYSELTKYK
jgi:hypothetical protein